MTELYRFLGGSLKIRISGFSRERFLNLCAGRGILLWNICFSGGVFEGWILTKDFWKLRSIVHKTKVKVVVLEKDGLPFLLPKLKRKWSFLLGALLALTIWLVSSFFLWEIKYTGNIQVTEDQLGAFFKSYGIKLGKPMAKLELSYLEKEIRRKFPQIIWTSLKQDGTNLIVDLKENELEIPEQKEKDGEQTEDLCAEHEGKIVSMLIRKGIPKVKIGDQVEKGQILVQGAVPIYADDGSIKDYLRQSADADVYLQHAVCFDESLPVFYEEKVFSGRAMKSFFMRFRDKQLFFLLGKRFYQENVSVSKILPKLLQKLEIPLFFGEITHLEYHVVRKKHGEEELRKLLSEKMLKFLSSLEEKGVQIIEKNVKIYDEGENWHLHGEFVVIEKTDFQ